MNALIDELWSSTVVWSTSAHFLREIWCWVLPLIFCGASSKSLDLCAISFVLWEREGKSSVSRAAVGLAWPLLLAGVSVLSQRNKAAFPSGSHCQQRLRHWPCCICSSVQACSSAEPLVLTLEYTTLCSWTGASTARTHLWTWGEKSPGDNVRLKRGLTYTQVSHTFLWTWKTQLELKCCTGNCGR